TVTVLIKFVSSVLMLGLKISAPIILSLFCTNLVLALLARMAPQTNIFMLSFQIKIGVGLVMLFLTVPMVVLVIKYAMSSIQNELMNMLLTLNPENVVR
ncbi:MAG TPA: flagellar biosynthetic protein FliR, partial [Candidatus Kapabacteria bacterium]|nr:flagellar biosynthetic protein FliR [Candidatus Kapabacteria bacterium]